jgi:hypothetical protein
VNVNALPAYIQRLERQFNPNQDFVFRANCVTNDYQFPQGGSGYVLSRKAVRMIEPHCEYFLAELREAEDMRFPGFLTIFGLSMFNVTDETFCGHSFSDTDIQRLRNQQYDSFDRCPDLEQMPRDDCRPFIAPVRQIIFFHEFLRTFEESLTDVKLLMSSKPTLHWYMPARLLNPRLCLLNRPVNASSLSP